MSKFGTKVEPYTVVCSGNTQEWQEKRSQGIGCSEVPFLFEDCKPRYVTLDELITRKVTGEQPDIPPGLKFKFWLGHAMEDLTIEYLRCTKGAHVDPWQQLLSSNLVNGLIGTPDGIFIENGRRLLEIKTTSRRTYEQYWKNKRKPPTYVQYQVQAQMLLTDTDECEVVLWHAMEKPRHFIVDRNEGTCLDIKERVEETWAIISKRRSEWQKSTT